VRAIHVGIGHDDDAIVAELREILEVTSALNQVSSSVERKTVSFARFLDAYEPKKRGFPICLVRTADEPEGQFIYTDAELAQLTKEIEKKKGKAVDLKTREGVEEGDGREETVEKIEIFEAREVEKAAKRLEKFGLGLQDFKEQKEPIFELSFEKKKFPLRSLAEALDRVKELTKEGLSLQRYKGLGEMNPEQLWETTMDPARRTMRRVSLEDAVEADEVFTTLMGDQVEPRRQFIERYAKSVRNLDI